MMGTGPVADTKSAEQVQSLLAIIADPKAAKAALADLAAAQKLADDKLAAANAASAGLDARDAALSTREVILTSDQDALAKAVDKQKAYEQATNSDWQVRIEAVTAREIAVSKVDNAAAERELAITNRELAVTDREAAIAVREGAAAQAQKKYEDALANMRSLVST